MIFANSSDKYESLSNKYLSEIFWVCLIIFYFLVFYDFSFLS